MYELDFNPYDDLDEGEDEGMVLIEEKPKRRKRKRNPEPVFVATPLLILGLAYLGWCGFRYSQDKLWTWQPWQRTLGRRRLLTTPSPTEAERQRQARQQADLDRATEAMMAPAPSVQEIDVWRKPTYRPVTEEVVSFIYP